MTGCAAEGLIDNFTGGGEHFIDPRSSLRQAITSKNNFTVQYRK
jgi:hypothetical protein